jgi:outer membrane receptor protein involved in Fe transport
MMYLANPDLPFEKTIAYELGYDLGLSDFFQLHIGAFFKDYYDLYSRVANAHTDQSLVIETPADDFYAEIRGVEIEIRKTYGRFINGWINYNYIKKAQANLGMPPTSWIPIVTDDPKIGRNGVLWGIPRSTIVTIQPNARGVITFTAPADWGPRLWHYPVLQNTNLSLQLFYQSGNQYRHPNASFRILHPDVWFRELDRYWANMRLSRLFQIKSTNFELYMDVSNILHTKFRNVPGGKANEDYFNDLWSTGRLGEVGTDKVSDPLILRTENEDVYWARLKHIILGLRLNF